MHACFANQLLASKSAHLATSQLQWDKEQEWTYNKLMVLCSDAQRAQGREQELEVRFIILGHCNLFPVTRPHPLFICARLAYSIYTVKVLSVGFMVTSWNVLKRKCLVLIVMNNDRPPASCWARCMDEKQVTEYPTKDASDDKEVDKSTACDIYTRFCFQKVCSTIKETDDFRSCWPGVVVQVGESLFQHNKVQWCWNGKCSSWRQLDL